MAEQNRLLISPEDDFAYGQGIPADATWRNLIPMAEFGLGIAPVSGEVMSARDAWDASGRGGNALLRGDYGQAASDYLNMGTGILGAIPGAGIVARGTKRGAAWMDRNLPKGFNRLMDAAMPSDPKNTTFSGIGPTSKAAGNATPDDFRYVRRTSGGNPDTGVGYMMFLDSGGNIDEAADSLTSYGKNIWRGNPVNPVRAEEIQDDVVKSLKNRPDLLNEYGATAEQLAAEMSPSDIVNSAGFWDAPNLVEAVWQDVLEPRGISSVITPDGMILFDPSGVKPHR